MSWGSLGAFWCATKNEIMMEQSFWTPSGQPALKNIRCLPVPREAKFSLPSANSMAPFLCSYRRRLTFMDMKKNPSQEFNVIS